MSLEAGLAAEEARGLRGFRNGVFYINLYQSIFRFNFHYELASISKT